MLNIADKALLVDILIEASKKCDNEFCANEYLLLINKVKEL